MNQQPKRPAAQRPTDAERYDAIQPTSVWERFARLIADMLEDTVIIEQPVQSHPQQKKAS